jgi:hypothetical protein
VLANAFVSDLYGFATHPIVSLIWLALSGVAAQRIVRKAGFNPIISFIPTAPFFFGFLSVLADGFAAHSQLHHGGFGFSLITHDGYGWTALFTNFLSTGVSPAQGMPVLYTLDALSLVVGWGLLMLVAFSPWPVQSRAADLAGILAARTPIVRPEPTPGTGMGPRALPSVDAVLLPEAATPNPALASVSPSPVRPAPPKVGGAGPLTAPTESDTKPCERCGQPVVVGREFFHDCPMGKAPTA